jgi:tRNA pseudouridine38-40 synthase
MKQNFALKIAYDGTDYFGWQKTSLGPSVEATLQCSLEQVLQEPLALQAASRTDRGVHAEGQWVNFFSEKNVPEDLVKRLNGLLPPSLRVLALHHMPANFHPTLHAQKKEYHYRVCISQVQLPVERFFSWHIPYQLNIEQMKIACTHFIGEHDFASFCNFRKNLNYQTKRRIIESLEMVVSDDKKLLFIIIGTHFLYKMVRNLVGTLVYVGRGKIEAGAIPSILQTGKRAAAGITAPAHGLTLKKIYYPQQIHSELF